MIKQLLTASFTFTLMQVCFSQTTLFDFDWRFHRGGAQRAEMPEFDDSQWKKVDLPHDWSIEDLPGTKSPFDPNAISQVSGGFTVGGTGWYRKTFSIPAGQKGKRIHIQFDGVYMNADFWLNGQHLGNHPYGYTSFSFDVTEKIKFAEKNIIAVQVKNEGQNSRWYSGSGIYRHVWLKVLDPIHISPMGIYITTPKVNASSSKVQIGTRVANTTSTAAQVYLVTQILNSKAVEVMKIESKQEVKSNDGYIFQQDVTISTPDLWSVESPSLYTTVTEVYIGSRLVDRMETKFGIRSISFDVTNGFRLNGKTVKLKGGCVHHDNGPLGSKAFDRAEERRVELLKASGYNVIRCSHNPPSPAFLDACDRLGML